MLLNVEQCGSELWPSVAGFGGKFWEVIWINEFCWQCVLWCVMQRYLAQIFVRVCVSTFCCRHQFCGWCCHTVGHTAAVRCVVILNTAEIMSCSDDGTVRRWSTSDGTCTQTCGTQTTAILSVASLPDGIDFVSCTADHTLQVWRGDALKQTIALPQPSLLMICVLSNGDVVTSTWSVTVTLHLHTSLSRIEVDSYNHKLLQDFAFIFSEQFCNGQIDSLSQTNRYSNI